MGGGGREVPSASDPESYTWEALWKERREEKWRGLGDGSLVNLPA